MQHFTGGTRKARLPRWSSARSAGSRPTSSASTSAAPLSAALALVAIASDGEELLDSGEELGAVEALGGGEAELGAFRRVEAHVERLDASRGDYGRRGSARPHRSPHGGPVSTFATLNKL
jgi:hypothetical protein